MRPALYFVEPVTGIEPATHSLQNCCATVAPHWHALKSACAYCTTSCAFRKAANCLGHTTPSIAPDFPAMQLASKLKRIGPRRRPNLIRTFFRYTDS